MWLVTGPDPVDGQWLRLGQLAARRIAQTQRDLAEWAVVLHGQTLEDLLAARSGIGRADVVTQSDSQPVIGECPVPGLLPLCVAGDLR